MSFENNFDEDLDEDLEDEIDEFSTERSEKEVKSKTPTNRIVPGAGAGRASVVAEASL